MTISGSGNNLDLSSILPVMQDGYDEENEINYEHKLFGQDSDDEDALDDLVYDFEDLEDDNDSEI